MKIVVEHIEQNTNDEYLVDYYDADVADSEVVELVIPIDDLKEFFDYEGFGEGFEDKFDHIKGHYTIDWNETFEQYTEDGDNEKYLITEYIKDTLKK